MTVEEAVGVYRTWKLENWDKWNAAHRKSGARAAAGATVSASKVTSPAAIHPLQRPGGLSAAGKAAKGYNYDSKVMMNSASKYGFKFTRRVEKPSSKGGAQTFVKRPGSRGEILQVGDNGVWALRLAGSHASSKGLMPGGDVLINGVGGTSMRKALASYKDARRW